MRLIAPSEAFLDEGIFVTKRAAGFTISFNMAFCCRCNSAVPKLPAAPAQDIAALSQRLSLRCFVMSIPIKGEWITFRHDRFPQLSSKSQGIWP